MTNFYSQLEGLFRQRNFRKTLACFAQPTQSSYICDHSTNDSGKEKLKFHCLHLTGFNQHN